MDESIDDIIAFHDSTKEPTKEGRRRCNEDLLYPYEIEHIRWGYEYPTLVSNGVKGTYSTIKSATLVKEFLEAFPIFSKKNENRIPLDNILIAGGSLASAIWKKTTKNIISSDDIEDIDLFIYGLSEKDATKLIYTAADKFGKNYDKGIINKSENAVTFISENVKIQFILRLYETPAQILHGFDLGSSMIGILNGKLVTTKFGLFCTKYRVNVVVPRYSSTTYENRLNKYLHRGYNIIMPNLDITKLKDGMNELGYIEIGINVDNCYNERILPEHDKTEISNYFYGCFKSKNDKDLSDYEINKSSPKKTIVEKYLKMVDFKIEKESISREDAINEMSLTYSRLRHKKYGGKIYISILYEDGKTVEKLKYVINRTIEGNAKFVEDYKEKAKITWKKIDPGSQICGSFNPLNITEEEWYGDYYLPDDIRDEQRNEIVERRRKRELMESEESEDEPIVKQKNTILDLVRNVSHDLEFGDNFEVGESFLYQELSERLYNKLKSQANRKIKLPSKDRPEYKELIKNGVLALETDRDNLLHFFAMLLIYSLKTRLWGYEDNWNVIYSENDLYNNVINHNELSTTRIKYAKYFLKDKIMPWLTNNTNLQELISLLNIVPGGSFGYFISDTTFSIEIPKSYRLSSKYNEISIDSLVGKLIQSSYDEYSEIDLYATLLIDNIKIYNELYLGYDNEKYNNLLNIEIREILNKQVEDVIINEIEYFPSTAKDVYKRDIGLEFNVSNKDYTLDMFEEL